MDWMGLKMGDKNRFGLDRYVPQDIRREIRSRCGFGCVICGLAYYDYEHFDPNFADAKEHNPAGMTLLCMQCNQKRARGTLSADTVARANSSPKCKQQGYASETFDFGLEPLTVILGGLNFIGCETLVEVSGKELLAIRPPINQGEPFRLSGQFSSENGKITLKIEDNEFSVYEENWDVEVSGTRITFRRSLGDIALRIRLVPPTSLVIEKMDMSLAGFHVKASDTELKTSSDGINWSNFTGVNVSNSRIGIRFR
ncbi:hypothetical protein [Pseudomonas sp. LAM2023]|uniref:hypothetical protein n=1 Tax=Pseudomonas sp. LAM2023 TaxID=2800477 RepID=UPI001F3450A9|nr:hypothetical protein [Pseudomonas sp. LAM2023]